MNKMATFIDLDPERQWVFAYTHWTLNKVLKQLAEIKGQPQRELENELVKSVVVETEGVDVSKWVEEYEESVFPPAEPETLPDCEFN